MANQDNDKDLPHSGGNEGSRGSRGQANRGANAGESTGDSQLPDEGKEDLRGDRDAQGGGGAGSNSSRSRNL